MENIEVFDNIVPPSYANFLEEALLGSACDWRFTNSTSGVVDLSPSHLIYEQFQFVSKPIDTPQNIFDNRFVQFFLFPLTLFALKNKIHFNSQRDLLKCKINLQTRAPSNNKGKFNYPHTDYHPVPNKLLTILYYLNESDGDTYFFKERFDGKEMSKDQIDNLTIIKKVSPKKGRLVVFNGNIMHAGSHPIDYPTRIVINYNLLLP